jgi:pSer/pThr/pTyr-binding forkhead associated (FHA) protein
VWLEGRDGVTAGERVRLHPGETVLVGRSRHCEFSLKKTPAFLRDRDGERERIRARLSYRATSRRHVRVTFLGPGVVEVENLSRNGTILDGQRVDRRRVERAAGLRHEIQLGRLGDVVTLEFDDLPSGAAPSSAA